MDGMDIEPLDSVEQRGDTVYVDAGYAAAVLMWMLLGSITLILLAMDGGRWLTMIVSWTGGILTVPVFRPLIQKSRNR